MRTAVLLAWLTVTLGCVGCASDLTTHAPDRFDLSGDWTLDGDADRPPPLKGQHRRQRNRRRDLRFDPAVLPMLYAAGMHIEQNIDSMGIAYREGGYRDVSWGDRELRLADVRAGWDGPALIIRTQAPSYDLTERYQLSSDGQELHVDIELEPAQGEELKLDRLYRRD